MWKSRWPSWALRPSAIDLTVSLRSIWRSTGPSKLRSCVKDKVAVLGSPSPIVLWSLWTLGNSWRRSTGPQSSGAAWKSRWPSRAPRPNSPYGLCGLCNVWRRSGGCSVHWLNSCVASCRCAHARTHTHTSLSLSPSLAFWHPSSELCRNSQCEELVGEFLELQWCTLKLGELSNKFLALLGEAASEWPSTVA